MSDARFWLSYTKIASFDRCRKQYWFRYLSGLPKPGDPMNPAGIVGTGVHRAMKALSDTGEAIDGARALETYLRMPAHEIAGPGTEAYVTAFGLFEHGCEAHAEILSEDRWAELSTYIHHRNVAISTKVDRADLLAGGRWQIIDWKTGRSDRDDDTDQQLDLGHLTLRTVLHLPREAGVTAIAWNLRTGHRRVRALERRDAAATVNLLGGIARRMQTTTDFRATPSGGCAFCEWRQQCDDADYIESGDYDWLDPEDLVDEEPELTGP
ncbi:MAG TPA: PD-(D/E)XK nuclease family protein [Tepidiformaceae bacterium]